MLGNRSLQVKMVKDDDPNVYSPPVELNEIAYLVTRSAVTILTAYISMDIVRRAAIYYLSAKV